jgi:hypothetical protein
MEKEYNTMQMLNVLLLLLLLLFYKVKWKLRDK